MRGVVHCRNVFLSEHTKVSSANRKVTWLTHIRQFACDPVVETKCERQNDENAEEIAQIGATLKDAPMKLGAPYIIMLESVY